MQNHTPAQSGTTDGLTLSPSLDFVVEAAQVPQQTSLLDRRVVIVCAEAVVLGVAAAFIAQILVGLIGFITNLAYFGELSLQFRSPAAAISRLGMWSIPIPVVGALLIGVMARYGSKAIRGHGIPEAMEQVLTNDSRIPARLTFLKPISSAISIGTGGPFGAEGPIIATGGALGSVLGQAVSKTSDERKTLLAAGAAAGMAATFGSPVSAVLLAIELLLFEFRPRSIIPVALAAATATGIRMSVEGVEPVFPMPNLLAPGSGALVAYGLIGATMGAISVVVTKIVYAIEDGFERLPIHWMWWPALGGIVVGVVGYLSPLTLGVGYDNITQILSQQMTLNAIAALCVWKFISWAIALGSGTSGGTLAPLFTIGGGLGALLGSGLAWLAPQLHIDPRIGALVGMASLFAGASRAMLASAVFAFETTLQPLGLLPLLTGCALAFMVASLLMKNSIMTEKIARRGIRTPAEYLADRLDHILVRDVATPDVVAFRAEQSIAEVQNWLRTHPLQSHQGYPILNAHEVLIGVITQKCLEQTDRGGEQRIADLLNSPVRFVYDDNSVREAANHMVSHGIGRLPVVTRDRPHRMIGMLTRSDILSAFQQDQALPRQELKYGDAATS